MAAVLEFASPADAAVPVAATTGESAAPETAAVLESASPADAAVPVAATTGERAAEDPALLLLSPAPHVSSTPAWPAGVGELCNTTVLDVLASRRAFSMLLSLIRTAGSGGRVVYGRQETGTAREAGS
jgi:hypothetical protein